MDPTIPRRRLFEAGLLAAVLGSEAEAQADSGSAQSRSSQGARDADMQPIVSELESIRQELRNQRAFPEIAPVRDAQKAFLRLNGKLPDYVDVGTDIWFNVHDWHVRWQQPMQLGRDAAGRYTIVLLQTLVVMRVDAASTFVSLGYDAPR